MRATSAFRAQRLHLRRTGVRAGSATSRSKRYSNCRHLLEGPSELLHKAIRIVCLALLINVALSAQTACPANVKAIPFHKVNQHQMIVGVSINRSGPYEFLVDTGSQMTVVDLSLAAELHLTATATASVAGASLQGPAMFARVDRLEVGEHIAANQGVLVYNMKDLQAAGFAIRGLLGEDFLSAFDVLIDKARNVICIDDTGAMLKGLQGEHIPLSPSANSAALPQSHIITAPLIIAK